MLLIGLIGGIAMDSVAAASGLLVVEDIAGCGEAGDDPRGTALGDAQRRGDLTQARTATQAALLPELASMDLARTLPRLEVPVVMVQGRHDQVAPGAAAQRYASTLQAPSKQLVWFENSAHTPHLEEPAKFRDLLLGVRASQLADIAKT